MLSGNCRYNIISDFIFTNVHTEINIKDLKNENVISFVLSLQNELDKFIDTLGQRIDNLTSTVDNLLRKLTEVDSCLVTTKTVKNKLLKRVISIEWSLLSHKQ